MTDLSSLFVDLLREMSPIHETASAFAKGGRECSQKIERIYDRLRDAELLAHDFEEELENVIEALQTARATLWRMQTMLIEHGIVEPPEGRTLQ